MRYLKGSVSLRNRDYELLHLVADARYMTHSQLFELARLHAFEFERPVFNWRVRRLVHSGLLRKQIVAYLGGDALYSITRAGAHALEETGVVYLSDFAEREKDPAEAQNPARVGTESHPLGARAVASPGVLGAGSLHSRRQSVAYVQLRESIRCGGDGSAGRW